MIAEKHFYIGHFHNSSQDADTVGITVCHIPKDVSCILRLQADLLENIIKTLAVAVDIRHYINHSFISHIALAAAMSSSVISNGIRCGGPCPYHGRCYRDS